MLQNPYDVGSEIAVVQSAPPQVVNASGAVNGASIDLDSFGVGRPRSMKVGTHLGAFTGTPTGVTATTKVQHRNASGDSWADYKPDGTNTAQTATGVAAASSDSNFSVNLNMAYRYIRTVTTVTFSGGSSPTAGVGTTCAFGGFPALPVTTPAS